MPARDLLPAGPPPGFPRCAKCPYVRTGPPHICVTCAHQTFEDIGHDACPACSQMLGADGLCPNWLCHDPRRRIGRIHAIAYQSGPLRQVINNYKYHGARGWSLIFGRLVLGWLEQHATQAPPGLIVANPTYTGTDSGQFAHTEAVLEAAAREDILRRWPFDHGTPRAIVKTRPTAKSANATAKSKRAAARELRSVLLIPDPARTAGQRVLVYDDVCTTASQLDAVAECLLDEGGASSAEALVLARAPWYRRT
jgi:predicted amidophosphoribosyltransferase